MTRVDFYPRRPMIFGLAIVAIVVVVLTFTGSSYELYITDSVLLACMGALVLQLLQGTAGLVSIGNSAFLLVGGFGTVFLNRAGWVFPFDVIGAGIFSAVCGAIVGIPALRLRSLFLALATLAAFYIAEFFGNLYQKNVPEAQSAGFYLDDPFGRYGLLGSAQRWSWLLLGLVLVLIAVCSALMHGGFVRSLRMIRDHEHFAGMFGVPVARYKLALFAFTSAIVGVEGGLMGHLTGNVVTDNYTLAIAFLYIAMIVVGGLDSVAGAVIGAFVVTVLPIWIPNVTSSSMNPESASVHGPEVAMVIYGILIILFVAFSSDGIVGLARAGVRLVCARSQIAAQAVGFVFDLRHTGGELLAVEMVGDVESKQVPL